MTRSASPWPPLAERRGAIAAASLLSLICVMQVDVRLFEDLLPRWTWWTSTWGWEVTLTLPGLLVLPLLGPGVWRRVLGGRPSPLAMLTGMGLGALGALLFIAYGMFLNGFWPADASFTAEQMVWQVTGILSAPLVEEFLYRGVLWVAVRTWAGTTSTILVTSAVFALAHGLERAADFPCLFAYGLLLGVLRHHWQSLAPTVLAHSLTNFGIHLLGPLLR